MSSLVKENGGINLAQGIPGFAPPSQLIQILKELSVQPIHQYPPGHGNLALLNAIVNKYQSHQTISLNNILITCGATEALSLLFLYLRQIISSSSSAMTFMPAYESYIQLPELFQTPLHHINLNVDGRFDIKELEHIIKSKQVRIFFVSSPGNPLGKIIPQTYFQHLIDICIANKCYLIIDAVYRELYYESPPYIPFDTDTPYVFYVNSFSKIFSITGWRVGYLMGHETHMGAIRNMHDYTGLCAPSILQEAIVQFIQQSDFGKEYIEKTRIALKSSYNYMLKTLDSLNFETIETDGGYFIWTALPKKYDDGFQIAIKLYNETGVAVVPGIHFTPKGKQYIRINIAHQQEVIEKASVLIKCFFDK